MKPSSEISDRAKRYRANALTQDWPEVCMFCGSTKDLQVDHLDGFEENGEPENLLILCRSCNQLKSAVYLKHGMGRRTVQYNPGLFSRLFGPKETYRVHGAAHPESRKARAAAEREERERLRREELETRKAELAEKRAERAARPVEVGRYKGFTIYKRGAGDDRVFYSTMDPDSWLDSSREVKKLIDTFKNPAPAWTNYRDAVAFLRGQPGMIGSPFQAARMIRSTPVARRYEYLDRMMRSNPSTPTFEQYLWAVRHHTRGAHDEGGAVIHATPKSKRREYAGKIAAFKSEHRKDEVPF